MRRIAVVMRLDDMMISEMEIPGSVAMMTEDATPSRGMMLAIVIVRGREAEVADAKSVA